jgi:hypothetical protein
MIDFKDEVVDAVKSMGWDGQEDMDETKLQWSFAGALLYAVTVITTIGSFCFPSSIHCAVPLG